MKGVNLLKKKKNLYKFSTFTKFINIKNKYFIINSNTCTILLLNKNDFYNLKFLYENKSEEELYKEFSKEKYNALKENNILIPKELNERNKIIKKYNQEIANHIKNNSFAELIQEIQIIPSYQCNLKCSYCSTSIACGNNSENDILTFKRITDVLREYIYLLKDSKVESYINLFKGVENVKPNKLNIRFFGGEPLLYPNLIEETVKFINNSELRKIKDKISYVINTNGTIYNKKFVDFCLKNNIRLAVSLDGITESQNKLRIFRNGKSSLKIVKNNLKKFIDLGLTKGILMVLNNNNMYNAKEIISFVRYNNLRALSVGNLRFISQRRKKFHEKYTRSLLEYYILGLENKINVRGTWTSMLEPFIRDLDHRNYACGANGGIFCIQPSGGITACHTISTPEFKSINDFINSENFKNGIRRNYIIDKCRGCKIEGICMGNCRAENESIYRDNGCDFYKEMFHTLLGSIPKIQETKKTIRR